MDISTSHSHPNPHPIPHHRKIELQSPQDLQYLQSNLAAAAQEKIDLHFPSSAIQPTIAPVISLNGLTSSQPQPTPINALHTDSLRANVDFLLATFLQQTWTTAAPNITVNGLDATSLPVGLPLICTSVDANGEREGVDFTYEPYDARLSSQVAELYAEVEALTAQVARLRREAPRNAARRDGQQLGEVLEQEERAHMEEIARVRRVQEEGSTGLELGPVPEGWHEDVAEMYRRGVKEVRRLGGLKQEGQGTDGIGKSGRGSLMETMGKVQRARTVVMDFE